MLEATVQMNQKETFLSQFGMIDFSFDKSPFKEKRKEAEELLSKLDFPTSKAEYWKYTRINKLVRQEYILGEQDFSKEIDLGVPSDHCLVFVNGYYSEDLSWSKEEEGFTFLPLSVAKENNGVLAKDFDTLSKKEEIFSMINTAFHQDGAFFHASKGKMTDSTFYVINISAGEKAISNPRNFIFMEEGSSAKMVFKNLSASEGYSFTNQLSEYFVAPSANLEINRIEDENEEAFLISNDEVQQAEKSQFKINTISLGGEIIRNNLNIDLQGSHTETWMNGLSLLDGKQHVDHHTLIHHREPNCVSHELYKTVADGSSTGVFNGKVFVHAIAQKTNAYQSNANMVLTDDASIYSKPELEIYADDVKCSHGSTTGQLDEEALFYLRSRGIGEKKARAVLLNAFLSDLVEQIGVEHLQEEIQAVIDQKYSGAN